MSSRIWISWLIVSQFSFWGGSFPHGMQCMTWVCGNVLMKVRFRVLNLPDFQTVAAPPLPTLKGEVSLPQLEDGINLA